jgi:isochorismate hydrolase
MVTSGVARIRREVYQYGSQVKMVPDACAATTEAEHNAVLRNLAILMAQIETTDDLVTSLA